MNRVILVAGATGRQGGAVARELLRQRWAVRVLTRAPAQPAARQLAQLGAEVVRGDFHEPRSLRTALAGVQGVFSVQDFWEHGGRAEIAQAQALIQAAQAAGVGHFVQSTVGGVDRTQDRRIAHFDSKRVIEAQLRQSGLHYTLFRPVTFFENFTSPRLLRGIRSRGVLPFTILPQIRFQMLALQDLAVFVAKAFDDPAAFAGREMELASDAFTLPQFTEAIGRVIQRPVRYRRVPLPAQWLVAAYVEGFGKTGHYKVGKSLIDQFRWNNASADGGWQADLPALRQWHPGLMRLDEWVRSIDWTGGDSVVR